MIIGVKTWAIVVGIATVLAAGFGTCIAHATMPSGSGHAGQVGTLAKCVCPHPGVAADASLDHGR